jgi:hypothetical protein
MYRAVRSVAQPERAIFASWRSSSDVRKHLPAWRDEWEPASATSPGQTPTERCCDISRCSELLLPNLASCWAQRAAVGATGAGAGFTGTSQLRRTAFQWASVI